jgi:hypothetical protein
MSRARRSVTLCLLLAGGIAGLRAAQMNSASPAAVPGIIPSGFGESVDRNVARVRAATERFKASDAAIAAGYPRHTDCVQVLVYEKMADGTFKLNGVEYLVPIAAWKRVMPSRSGRPSMARGRL